MLTKKIAIDGPSGAGKSTLAKILANKIHFTYIDTGALYRAVGYETLQFGLSPFDSESVVNVLPNLKISFHHVGDVQHVFVDEKDITGEIRTNPVSAAASAVSAIPKVREFLFNLQRSIAEKENVIMDGRDIGTVILPDADVKIFLTATSEARAKRRYEELKGTKSECSFDDILMGIVERDKRDSERDICPLRPADDSFILDNSDMNLDQTVCEALRIIGSKIDV